MSVRMTMLLAVGALAALAVVGCGGDDAGGGGEASAGGSSSSSASVEVTTSTLSKAQFVQRAKEACRAEKGELLTELGEYSKENRWTEGSPEYIGVVQAVYLPMYQAELDAIRALGAPAGEKAKVEAMLAAQQDDIAAAAEQDPETFRELEKSFVKSTRLLIDYGLPQCAVGQPPKES